MLVGPSSTNPCKWRICHHRNGMPCFAGCASRFAVRFVCTGTWLSSIVSSSFLAKRETAARRLSLPSGNPNMLLGWWAGVAWAAHPVMA
jgi:hypothetical protein